MALLAEVVKVWLVCFLKLGSQLLDQHLSFSDFALSWVQASTLS